MEQLKKDNIVRLEFSSGLAFDGVTLDVTKDKATIMLEDTLLDNIKFIESSESVYVTAYTAFGIRFMNSAIIKLPQDDGIIEITNPPAQRIIQKREFLRIVMSFNFNVIKHGKTIPVRSVNLSAGSIAFRCESERFSVNDNVKVILPQRIFGKEIVCNGHIQRTKDTYYVVKYDYLNKNAENMIAKKIFEMLDEILN
ncbi:PilZ domain-containing protein [bacterium]|nr:PilZ domain-containing protein [bacterium]